MWWILPTLVVVVQNGTTNQPVPNQRVMVLKPSPQGMPQFLDTLETDRKGMARTDVRGDSSILIATQYLGELYVHPLLPGLDTLRIIVYDTGQARIGTLSYQGLFHVLGDTLPGYFLIEALEFRLVEPIRGRVEDLVFPIPEGAQVLQVFPQAGWDIKDSALVFTGYLNPEQPVVQIQWVWEKNAPTTLKRKFPRALGSGTLYAQPGFSLQSSALGEAKEVTFPQGKLIEYTVRPVSEFSLKVRPRGGMPASAYATRWILGVGGGVVLALLLLLALRKRYAQRPGEGAA